MHFTEENVLEFDKHFETINDTTKVILRRMIYFRWYSLYIKDITS